ncbi:HAD hydrolase-like protein (plasmid) [Rhizobium sp. CB3171]|uniref:HAD hydrolase-like protein n=1 Tax=Rhizobium sp. CB3171 TaxID=3039157 RepID=UPI0024B0B2D4|nr:HAD hydrolase-like protein [Rhizobium sp. CB3171]WFU07081.1 HAD hydrolase-like protein [Rhizobium sp. CB3171]
MAKSHAAFFEYAASRFRTFNKEEALIVGDRLDADTLWANQFGIESCRFNPLRAENWSSAVPTIEVAAPANNARVEHRFDCMRRRDLLSVALEEGKSIRAEIRGKRAKSSQPPALCTVMLSGLRSPARSSEGLFSKVPTR